MALPASEGSVDNEKIRRLRELLVILHCQKKLKFQRIANQLGVHRTYISRFASGERMLNSNLISQLEVILLKNKPDQPSHLPQIPFVPTTDVREMFTLLEDCREKNLFGVIAGGAGLGKSTTIQRYANGIPDVSLYEPDPNVTIKGFLREVSNIFGFILTGTNADEMSKELTKFLTRNPRFLIIDEFGRIMRNGNMRIIETLRAVRDASGRNLGIVLSGHADDFANLVRNGKAQIYSRLGPVYELQGPSKEEALEIVKPLWMTDDAKQEMARLIVKFAKRDGIRGILEELYDKSVRLAGNEIITLETLQEAGKRTVYGYRSNRF